MSAPTESALATLSDATFSQYVGEALKNYHNVLMLSRSPLANSTLVQPTLILDDVSPTADERGNGLRLVLRWAVARLAPTTPHHPFGVQRPFDDPTWRDPTWWRYNILRHRYIEPLHPDEFFDGGRFTETLVAITGISSHDAFYDERNRAITAVTQRLRQQLRNEEAYEELHRLAMEETYQPLHQQSKSNTLLGIASIFEGVFPRTRLIQLAEQEDIRNTEAMVEELIRQRYLRSDESGQQLWLSPLLRNYIYQRQARAKLRLRHQRVAEFYHLQHDRLLETRHLQQAEEWSMAATVLLEAATELIHEMQVNELKEALLLFKANTLPANQWCEIQILLSDLHRATGDHDLAVAACRQALKAVDRLNDQARIYRRMGKLYEQRNQLHALNYYQQAIENFDKASPEYVETLKDRGWVFILQEEWEQAEADLLQAASQSGTATTVLRADIYHALGALYTHQKQHDKAVYYLRRSLALREQAGDLVSVAKSYGQLGILYEKMQKIDEAILAYFDALHTAERAGNQELTATTLMNIGVAHHRNVNLADAIENYQKSLLICQTVGLTHSEATAHLNLAEAFADLQQNEPAIHHWQIGYELSRKQKFQDQLDYFLDLRANTPALQTITIDQVDGAMANAKTVSATLPLNLTLIVPAPHVTLPPEERTALNLAQQHSHVTPRTLMDAAHISKATATRKLAELVEKGFLTRHGQGRGVYYTIAQPSTPQATTPTLPLTPAKLAEAQRAFAKSYAIDQLSLPNAPSPTNTNRIDLQIKFQHLPDLSTFFALERALSQHMGITVNLVLDSG